MEILKSKTVISGIVTILVGLASMLAPEVVEPLGLTLAPMELIGAGLSLIFVRLGIAKVA